MRYLLSTPQARAEPPPLLCFLHGYDEAAPRDIFEALTLHGPLAPRSVQWRERCVVVAPQLPRAGDVWHRFGSDVASIVDSVAQRTNADRTRLYLTGFSYGGNGVFDLARACDWAALWAVDPTRVPVAPFQQPIWVSIGEAARPQSNVFAAGLGLTTTGDRVLLDEGLDHVACAAHAYSDPQILAWLLRYARG